MGKWLKVTGKEPRISWARGVSSQHNALRREFEGGFYAVFAESHVPAVVRGFRSWKLRVDGLDGPPPKIRSKRKLANEKPVRTTRERKISFRLPKRQDPPKDKEEEMYVFGTTVADIRGMAFNHSKGEIAYLLGVTTDDLNKALLDHDIEPIYFGYKCKRCDLRFQGSGALEAFRTHVLLCK